MARSGYVHTASVIVAKPGYVYIARSGYVHTASVIVARCGYVYIAIVIMARSEYVHTASVIMARPWYVYIASVQTHKRLKRMLIYCDTGHKICKILG